MINVKSIPEKSGIYILTCLKNNKVYVGKAKNLLARISRHSKSENHKLNKQIIDRSIKKHGWKNFDIEILHEFDEPVELNILLALETAFINFYNSTDKKIGYNICIFSNDRTGIKHTEETKEKMSKSHSGKVCSEETKKKLSLIFKGKRMGEESSAFGRRHTEEAKRRIAESRAGKKLSEESKKKIAESRIGKTMSYDTKNKISLSLRGKYVGENCANFDHNIYKFFNKTKNETFIGTRSKLRELFGLSHSDVSTLISGKRKSSKGWILIKE